MSCTACAKVRTWHLVSQAGDVEEGRVLSAGCAGKGRSQLLREDQVPQRSPALGVEHFVAGSERRSDPPKRFLWDGTGTTSCGRGFLSMFTTSYSYFPSTDVFPGQMEGVKLVVNKVLSSHFQVLPLL